MDKKILKLSELLPQDLTETQVESIIGTIVEFVSSEVKTKVKVLEAKFAALMRTQIDLLKEQALKELKEQDETYQELEQLKKLKEVMGVKTVKIDEAKSESETREENEYLVEQLNAVAEDVVKYRTLAIGWKKKFTELKEKAQLTIKENADLKESKEPFKSSEKGLIITEGNKESEVAAPRVVNQFLSNDVLNLMD